MNLNMKTNMHRWIFTKRKQAQDQDSNFDKENKDFNIKEPTLSQKCKLLYTGDKQSIGHNKQESSKDKNANFLCSNAIFKLWMLVLVQLQAVHV